MRSRRIAYALSSIFLGTLFFSPAAIQLAHDRLSASSYIVQSSSAAEAGSLVTEVGGRVTHRLNIINAVGARLTVAQLASLRESEQVRRIYEDRRIEATAVSDAKSAAKCGLSAEPELAFDDDEVTWTVTNNGKSDLRLSDMTIIWPSANDELEEIEFGDRDIFIGRIFGISAAFEAMEAKLDDEKLELPAGKSKTLEIEFDDDVVRDQDSYEIRLGFSKSCSVEFPLPPARKFEGDSDIDAKRTYIASLVGADALHWKGITGTGIGVAVIDTGMWFENGKSNFLRNNSKKADRVSGHYDAIKNKPMKMHSNSDRNGHGSHVTSLIVSSRHKDSEFNGIAPDARLVAVQAFDKQGMGTYADVIRGIGWVVDNSNKLGIRILNLSFGAAPHSYYWDDALNQAVMSAWQSGIVVVASAGNGGPAPMTIGVPGNVPYIITVGGMTDSVTPLDWTDDTMMTVSAAGPTIEAFVKPDLVAPGGHVRGMMEKNAKLALDHPHFYDGDSYFTMSGTSQAAAVVSGSAALLLQAEPWLTPDDVKCRLLISARPAADGSGNSAYSAFQMGAGLVDVYAAVESTATGCANRGLDVEADLSGKAHFRGPARQDEKGSFYIEGAEKQRWDGSFSASDGHVWGRGMLWNDGMLWNVGMLWNDGTLWNVGMLWNDGTLWNDGDIPPLLIDVWVEQE